MDESVKTQQLLISYALKKGGWRHMPLPSDWIQITHQNAVLYINTTGCTILDVHPFKYLALGNEKEKKMVKKTIAQQYDPKKKNQIWISCWVTCPFPEYGWIKLYHITKHSIIYYYQPTNTLTAKHPCRLIKAKSVSTKSMHSHSHTKHKNNKEKHNTLDSFDKLIKLLNSPGHNPSASDPSRNPSHPQSPLHLDKFIEEDLQNMKNMAIQYGKSQTHTHPKQRKNKKIKKKAIKTRLRPCTPPPHSSNLQQRFDIVPRPSIHSISKTASKKTRRTQSSLPNGNGCNAATPKPKSKSYKKLNIKNEEKLKSKTKTKSKTTKLKQIQMSAKTFKKLKTKNKAKSVHKKSHKTRSKKAVTKGLSIKINPQMDNARTTGTRKKKAVSFELPPLNTMNTTFSPTSYSSEQLQPSQFRQMSLRKVPKSPTPKTKKMIKKSNKKRCKNIKKLELTAAATPPSPARPKRRSLSNKFDHMSGITPAKPLKQVPMAMDAHNTILHDYKWGSSYTHSLSKSVYMYAASRGNNVLFPVQNTNNSTLNNVTKTRRLSNPKNKYKKAKKTVKSSVSLPSTHNHQNKNNHNNDSDLMKAARAKITSPQKRRRNAAVGMSSQIQSQLLNFDDKLIFVNDATYNDPKDDAVPDIVHVDESYDNGPDDKFKSNSLPTTPTLLPQSTSDNIYETAKADRTTPKVLLTKTVPNMSFISKSSPVTPVRHYGHNNSPGSDLDLDDLCAYGGKYNAHKLEIKSNIHHHSNSDSDDELEPLEASARNTIVTATDKEILRKPSSTGALHKKFETHTRVRGRTRFRRQRSRHHSHSSSSLSRKSSISVSLSVSVSSDNERRMSSDSDSSDQSSISSVSSDSSSSNSSSVSSRSHSRTSRSRRSLSRSSRDSSRSATPSRYRSGSRSDLNNQKTQKLQKSLFNNMANMMLMMTNTSLSTTASGPGPGVGVPSLTNDKYSSSSFSFVNMNGILSPPAMSPCYGGSVKWEENAFNLDSPPPATTHKTNNFDDFMTFMTSFGSEQNKMNMNMNNNNNIFNTFGAGTNYKKTNGVDITTTNMSDNNEKGVAYQNRIASIMLANSYAEDTSGSASDVDAVNGSVV